MPPFDYKPHLQRIRILFSSPMPSSFLTKKRSAKCSYSYHLLLSLPSLFGSATPKSKFWAMGMTISTLVRMLFAKKEMRILMVGLDAAGKTTILYKLKLGEVITTIPTIGIPICSLFIFYVFFLKFNFFPWRFIVE